MNSYTQKTINCVQWIIKIIIIIIIIIAYSLSKRWWFFTGVWVTASLLKAPGHLSVFWSVSIM